MLTFEKLEKLLDTQKPLYEIFQDYDQSFKRVSDISLRDEAIKRLEDMKESVKRASNAYCFSFSGMSGLDSLKIKNLASGEDTSKVLFSPLIMDVIYYAVALLEENQRMGKIVACPTAGSCGIVPACILAVSDHFKIGIKRQVSALITAGGIGSLISNEVGLAGAVAGCQAECGVASSMAAGAVVCLLNGSNDQILSAAALALKNVLGLVCDPIAGLVEVPCVKRNGFLAVSGMVAAQMSLAGIKSVVPLREVVDAMKEIGHDMSSKFKETSEGGLATTKTGLRIEKELKEKWSKLSNKDLSKN